MALLHCGGSCGPFLGAGSPNCPRKSSHSQGPHSAWNCIGGGVQLSCFSRDGLGGDGPNEYPVLQFKFMDYVSYFTY